MPHIIIEYSANLEERLGLDGLMDTLHAAALVTGVFPLGGLRVRAHRADRYRIATCRVTACLCAIVSPMPHAGPAGRCPSQSAVTKASFRGYSLDRPICVIYTIDVTYIYAARLSNPPEDATVNNAGGRLEAAKRPGEARLTILLFL